MYPTFFFGSHTILLMCLKMVYLHFRFCGPPPSPNCMLFLLILMLNVIYFPHISIYSKLILSWSNSLVVPWQRLTVSELLPLVVAKNMDEEEFGYCVLLSIYQKRKVSGFYRSNMTLPSLIIIDWVGIFDSLKILCKWRTLLNVIQIYKQYWLN